MAEEQFEAVLASVDVHSMALHTQGVFLFGSCGCGWSSVVHEVSGAPGYVLREGVQYALTSVGVEFREHKEFEESREV